MMIARIAPIAWFAMLATVSVAGINATVPEKSSQSSSSLAQDGRAIEVGEGIASNPFDSQTKEKAKFKPIWSRQFPGRSAQQSKPELDNHIKTTSVERDIVQENTVEALPSKPEAEVITEAETIEVQTIQPVSQDPVSQESSFFDELEALSPEQQPAVASTSYLAELGSLADDSRRWSISDGEMIDLTFGQPEDFETQHSYLHELSQLVNAPAKTNENFRYTGSGRHYTLAQRAPSQPYMIPGATGMQPAGGGPVAELFAPLNHVSVSLNKSSSAPPELPNQAEGTILNPPDNLAWEYLDMQNPGLYLSLGYGAIRAPRNTYAFKNNPLYFEDPNLERCGISKGCFTEVCSAAHFGAKAAMLPYLMTYHHPRDCVRALPECTSCNEFGHDAYFPGWSWKAAAVQAAAVTGIVFIFP